MRPSPGNKEANRASGLCQRGSKAGAVLEIRVLKPPPPLKAVFGSPCPQEEGKVPAQIVGRTVELLEAPADVPSWSDTPLFGAFQKIYESFGKH